MEAFHAGQEIMLIECHDCIGASVDGRFQNHVVIRVGQSWPPSEGKLHRPCHCCQIINYMTNFGAAQSTYGQMLWPGQYCFVLKYEWDRQQQFKLLVESGQQKLPGSAFATPQGRHYHISVENVRRSHFLMILHAIS